MFRFDESLKVYLHRKPVDFRLSINGLAMLVEQALGLDPFAPCAYVFSNRRRDRVKILGWERNGFWLLLKRLEKDWFIWPSLKAVPALSAKQLHWLLEGIDIAVVQRHAQDTIKNAYLPYQPAEGPSAVAAKSRSVLRLD